MVSSVVHSGFCSWVGVWRAKRRGLDLRVVVRVTREARFVGGFGKECRSTGTSKKSSSRDKEKEKGDEEGDVVMHVSNEFEGGTDDDSEEERAMLVKAGYGEGYDDGRELLSAGWGNSHDGAGMEILKAEFVKRGFARSHTRHNRSQRMLEYAERRAALGCKPTSTTLTTTTNLPSSSTPTPPSSSSYASSQVIRPRKKRRLNPELDVYADRENQKGRLSMAQDAEDADVCAGYTITFSVGFGSNPAFQYAPTEFRSILFPDSVSSLPSQRKSKRKRSEPKDVVVETACERFWIAVEEGAEVEKYLVALVPTQGKTSAPGEKRAGEEGKTKEKEDSEGAKESSEAPGSTKDTGAISGTVSSPPPPPETAADKNTSADDPICSSVLAITEEPHSQSSPVPTLQILHRHLSPTDLDFSKDGVDILGPADETGARKGWRMEARTWRWCSSTESEAWRAALKVVGAS